MKGRKKKGRGRRACEGGQHKSDTRTARLWKADGGRRSASSDASVTNVLCSHCFVVVRRLQVSCLQFVFYIFSLSRQLQ